MNIDRVRWFAEEMEKEVQDLSGQRFERLTVFSQGPNDKRGETQWFCVCDCGGTTLTYGWSLKNGHTKSCGCLQKDIVKNTGKSNTTHGEARLTREYSIWANMKNRCLNPKVPSYKHYGRRGIQVCNRWLDSYENFLADMGRCPKGLTIERIDNNGNYAPGNCRWATYREQGQNTRNNVWIEFNGKRLIRKDWARKLGIHDSAWHYWLNKGFTNEEALQYFMRKKGVPND